MKVIENNLKNFRKIRNLSQIEVSVKLKMSPDYYRKLEKGEQIPGSQYVGLLEKAFGAPFKDLYPHFFSPEFLDR